MRNSLDSLYALLLYIVHLLNSILPLLYELTKMYTPPPYNWVLLLWIIQLPKSILPLSLWKIMYTPLTLYWAVLLYAMQLWNSMLPLCENRLMSAPPPYWAVLFESVLCSMITSASLLLKYCKEMPYPKPSVKFDFTTLTLDSLVIIENFYISWLAS